MFGCDDGISSALKRGTGETTLPSDRSYIHRFGLDIVKHGYLHGCRRWKGVRKSESSIPEILFPSDEVLACLCSRVVLHGVLWGVGCTFDAEEGLWKFSEYVWNGWLRRCSAAKTGGK